MRQNTFFKKVNKLCHELGLCPSTTECNHPITVNDYTKSVTVVINPHNQFTVTKDTLEEAFESALRILKGYGPKHTRSRYSEN